ncbi:hypothetical protein FUSNEC_GEN_279_03015 [Fusobacterium necrophorum subsp. funduliforme]
MATKKEYEWLLQELRKHPNIYRRMIQKVEKLVR